MIKPKESWPDVATLNLHVATLLGRPSVGESADVMTSHRDATIALKGVIAWLADVATLDREVHSVYGRSCDIVSTVGSQCRDIGLLVPMSYFEGSFT